MVSMNLPAAIVNMKKSVEADRRKVEDLPESSAQVSNKVVDVEYETEYDEMFDGISSMAHQSSEEEEPEDDKTKKVQARDYSIDLWNGSPGLGRWGYDDNNQER